ncbi:MAG: GH92 family glycosyl hydrolase [Saprospiraceae bacterium]|nr:GH92 family glycosyl hydrolase [Saprospiraceae bacterium]
MDLIKCALIVLLLAQCTSSKQPEYPSFGAADWVDPLIGTADHGHVYPGVTVPFGSVQLSPDNGTQGWDWCSGYHYSDSTLVGFSHTHLSGTGIGDLYDLLMMPVRDDLDLSAPVQDIRKEGYATTFSHEDEEAKAGYYRVKMKNGISAEMTATTRVGFHYYTFPQNAHPGVVLDLGYHINWDQPLETQITQKSETLFTGYRFSTGWAKNQRIYFAIEFSQAPASTILYDSTSRIDGTEANGVKLRAYFKWPANQTQILVKVGISSASVEGALLAMHEIPDWDFERVRFEAGTQWNNTLSKIEVTTEDDALLRTFYTALYRTHLAPVIYSDAKGQYWAADSSIASADDFTRFDIFSLWDTFRGEHPLLTIVQPDRVHDFVRSLLAHYEEYGLLPVWSLLGNETNTMTGYHAAPVITDAILKGYRDFDLEKAFKALETSAMQDIRGTDVYRRYGFIPYELAGQSVTRTLEYAYDDWCIAQVALILGKKDKYDYYMKRSRNYRNLFDPGTGFMRAKMSDGSWKTPFDPLVSEHNFDIAEYTEGNAWQHSWFVPHDIRSLIKLHGGDEPFVQRLDSMFLMNSQIHGTNVSADISGLIGQYAHGNEPSHHIPYLYNYAGAPWKTQERVRQILTTQYNDTPKGLCGNEDCGQMSAWYVVSAMGLYPVNPAEGVYVIGTPLFNRVVIDVGNGNTFTIRARFLTPENIYIQAATLQGQPLTRSYVRHFEIMEGGELILEMGPQPNYLHWTDPEARPPSDSDLDIQ